MKNNSLLVLVAIVLLVCSVIISYVNNQKIQQLQQQNDYLISQVDALIYQPNESQTHVPDSLSDAVNEVAYEMAETGKGLFKFINTIIEGISNENRNDSGDKSGDKPKSLTQEQTQRIIVTSKYRMEDRYVDYFGVILPEVNGTETGQVDLNISIDIFGYVKSSKLKSVNGITNEDVIEACKKAALKTKFNSNLDLDGYQSGTITYFFKKD